MKTPTKLIEPTYENATRSANNPANGSPYDDGTASTIRKISPIASSIVLSLVIFGSDANGAAAGVAQPPLSIITRPPRFEVGRICRWRKACGAVAMLGGTLSRHAPQCSCRLLGRSFGSLRPSRANLSTG